MINKVAEMTRLAEVRGCIAAFHDAGIVKCASEEAFDSLCENVAGMIGYDYDLEKIAQATDLEIARDRKRRMSKTAGRMGNAWNAVKGAFSTKSLRDATNNTRKIKDMIADAKATGNYKPSEMREFIAGSGLREARMNQLKALGRNALAYGGSAAALAGAGYGGKKGYDAYVGD